MRQLERRARSAGWGARPARQGAIDDAGDLLPTWHVGCVRVSLVTTPNLSLFECDHTDGEDASLGPRLPRQLQPLGELAYDLWWSWQPGGAEVFRDVDPHHWERCGNNPVKLLRDASPAQLAAAARDSALVARVGALHERWRRYRERPFAWADVASRERPVAFFCAEYGLHPSLPIYSGGLGILAGDLLKEASDAGLPMIAVGLHYRRGYFRQRLDRSGWQHEYWTEDAPEGLPMRLERAEGGRARIIRVPIRGRDVLAKIWHVDVGRVPLLLLDTNVPENDAASRWITSTLYVSDRRFRLMQYAVLAIGGVRALRALGVEPSRFHLNEGHASLATLELAREARARGTDVTEAIERAKERVVFTTHTPVASGNERYAREDVAAVLPGLAAEMQIDEGTLFSLGAGKDDASGSSLGMTELALRTAGRAVAVSRRHGEVSRGMWQHLWPGVDARDVPIAHVTNGVHLPTWMSAPMRSLLERHGGRIEEISDEDLWAARNALRAELVAYVRDKSVEDRLARGEPLEYAEGAATTFEPDVLTLGFARRVASYKRLHLLIHDARRAIALLGGSRPVQVVIAGRAHPADDEAKRLVQAIFSLKNVEGASRRVTFLEDYDLTVAHELVAGCDVWLNLPRPPLEASGTSGMKAALNGGLNLSVLDGWWCEAFDDGSRGSSDSGAAKASRAPNGWAIASASDVSPEIQDARDAEALYGLLEREVVPTFYARDAAGLPRAWLAQVRASLRTATSRFTTTRMLSEYADRIYR